MKSFRTFAMPLLLALAIGGTLHAEEPEAGLMTTTLPPGVYPAYYMGNPTATHPCAYVPANNCLIIVLSAMGQTVGADNLLGPVTNVQPSTDPAWRWEAMTTEMNKLYYDRVTPPVTTE